MTSCVPDRLAWAAYVPAASRPIAASPPRSDTVGTSVPADSCPNDTVAVLTVERFLAKNMPTLVIDAVLMAAVPAALVPGVSVSVFTPLTAMLAVTPEAANVWPRLPLEMIALME